MKKNPIRRIMASGWLWGICFVVMAVGLTVTIATTVLSGMRMFPAIALSAACSVLVTHAVLRAVWFVVVWTNGGPFHKGDTVRILVGPHQGRVSRVYEEWKERNQVKVDLGAELSRKVEDVFSFIELKRERGAEPASSPYSEPAARSPQG